MVKAWGSMPREPNQRFSAAANRPKALKALLWMLIGTLLSREFPGKRDSMKSHPTSPAVDIPEFTAREYYDR